jgi:peptidyl-prolyl cis-trans isomerase SurA
MSARREIGVRALVALAMALGVCSGGASMRAQQASAQKAGAAGQSVTLDRVVAIVNGDLVLESDVDAERQFEAFRPLRATKSETRDEIINRLINRALILQQIAMEPEPPVPEADVDQELILLRKTIPKCAAYHCDTDAGWQRFVTDQGVTLPELRAHWKLRMEVLRFIEERFRMGIRITDQEIDEYYKSTLVPAFQKQNAPAPAENTIKDKIQEILLQQQVDKLLDDWLAALRAQGSVRILKPGEEAP